jgi:hypothetical protein
MLPVDLEKFNTAVELANAGHKKEARSRLAELLRAYPNDANVLLWFAFTSTNPVQSRLALNKVRVLDPDNPSLPGAESWLNQQMNRPSYELDPQLVMELPYQSSVAAGAADSGGERFVVSPTVKTENGSPIGRLMTGLTSKLSGLKKKV